MTVHVRSGNGWYAVPDGKLHIGNGNVPQTANGCYIKVGGVGQGGWHDSGYGGLPAVPGTPAISGWSTTQVNISWSGGAGGAPVSNYSVECFNSGDPSNLTNRLGIWDTGSVTSLLVGVSPNTEYQFRVSAKSAAGLLSAPSGLLRVGIGYLNVDTYGYVAHSRGWNLHITQHGFNGDNLIVVTIPSSVSINAVHWSNMHTPQSGTLIYGDRDINWILNSIDYGSISTQLGNNPVDRDYPTDGDIAATGDIGIRGSNGRDTLWGVKPVGAGWSTTGNGTYMLWVDDLWFDGAEAYSTKEIVSSTGEKANYYW